MTHAAVQSAGPITAAARRLAQSAAVPGRWLAGIILARATRRALSELPDDLLTDIGVTRSSIAFIARDAGRPSAARPR
jgi:uncharacterized protein YjiS (DUF1127 family)